MVSRTPEGKHTKQFIVIAEYAGEQFSSGNDGLREAFSTREAAQEAITKFGSLGVTYKVRQK
jgi:hypothetical protein